VTTGYDVFCSGLAHLPDGNVFLAGGNKNAQLQGIVQTHLFNHLTNTWSPGPDMAAGRWYPERDPGHRDRDRRRGRPDDQRRGTHHGAAPLARRGYPRAP
jgi:hypothetical protein